MKMNDATHIAAFGALVSALVVFLFSLWAGNIQKREADKDKEELRASNKELQAEIKNLRDSLSDKTADLIRLSAENAQLYKDFLIIKLVEKPFLH